MRNHESLQSGIGDRLNQLAQLRDGWLDGDGKAPDPANLMRLYQAFRENFDKSLPIPSLYPTPTGGVQAEWSLNEWEVSLEIEISSLRAEFEALKVSPGIFQDSVNQLDLANSSDWHFLNKMLKSLAAKQ